MRTEVDHLEMTILQMTMNSLKVFGKPFINILDKLKLYAYLAPN